MDNFLCKIKITDDLFSLFSLAVYCGSNHWNHYYKITMKFIINRFSPKMLVGRKGTVVFRPVKIEQVQEEYQGAQVRISSELLLRALGLENTYCSIDLCKGDSFIEISTREKLTEENLDSVTEFSVIEGVVQ